LDVRDVTHQYVPKIIALANIIQNPRKFGITLTNLPNKPYFAAINPASTISVSNFMSAAQLTPALNKKLNPQYNSVNYAVNSNQHLLLPVANQSIYYTSMGINTIPTTLQDDAAPITPLIANNNLDTASDNNDEINVLAQQGSTSVTANSASKISAASAPQAISASENAALATDLLNDTNSSQGVANRSQTSNNYTNYTVVQGDTLYSISKKFNLPIDTLKTDNQIIDNSVQLNQQLRIQNTASNS
jgi:membrane-bound lytic murein transglycosylase D